METTLAMLAAALASVFAFDLGRSARQRPRLHAQAWAIAMLAYAAATWALAAGLGFGWSDPTFRIFYLLGAIANIPLLATGSVALVAGDEWGRRTARVVAGFIILGAIVTLLAPLQGPVQSVGIPEGSELFTFTVELGGVTLPGPRFFAVISGALGTLVIVGFAMSSALRVWNANRRLALGNVLIVLGALAPAAGGSLTAMGEGGGLALSLLVGAALLYGGYRLAVSARVARGR